MRKNRDGLTMKGRINNQSGKGVRSLFFIVRDERKSPSFPNQLVAVRLNSTAGRSEGAGACGAGACGVVGQPWK